MNKRLSEIIAECCDHISKTDDRYGPFASSHEALGVLAEEFTELQNAIHANALESIRDEAIDVAAAAMRLAYACREEHFRKRSVK